MSIDLVAAALWLDMEPSKKLVLVALCDRADLKTGKCWPGRDELAIRTSLSQKTITAHLRTLEDEEWVKSKRGNYRRGETTTRWVRVRRILADGEARKLAFRARFDGIDDDDFPEPFEAPEPDDKGLGYETTPNNSGELGVIDGRIDVPFGNDQGKSTDVLGEAASLVTVIEPSDPPSKPTASSPQSVVALGNASDEVGNAGENFSPAAGKDEFPEPDDFVAEPRLRLLASRFCDACGEAFSAAEGETICPDCMAAYVAVSRERVTS